MDDLFISPYKYRLLPDAVLYLKGMKMASSSKQKTDSMMSLDRLSSLPAELINLVLNHLPIKDTVRTSALSRFWRCRWMLIPDLIFDARSIPNGTLRPVDIVNYVLLLHNAQVSRFDIRNYLECSCHDVDRWIHLLARKSVKELLLEFPSGNRYKLPSSLFFCQNLSMLKLRRSVLNMPSHVKGLCNLVELDLRRVTFTNETIANLVTNCPLQKLILISCDGFTHLNICASNLEIFCFRGPCESLSLRCTPKLVVAYMGVLPLLGQTKNPTHSGTRCNLEDVLGGLLSVRKLYLLKDFLEILVPCLVPGRLCVTFPRLCHLTLEVDLDYGMEVLTAINLFRCSPCLTTLSIDNFASRQQVHLYREVSSQTQLHIKEAIFPRLKTVKLSGFKGRELELRFLQFILSYAVVLETISITWERSSDQTQQEKTRVLQNMLQFERASPTAKVLV